jgi:hypothetical protein
MSSLPKMPKVSKPPRSKTQTYQQKKNAVCIVLYDQTGETLSPAAQREAEDAILEVAMNHNLLLSIATT